MKIDVHFEESNNLFPVTMLSDENLLEVKFENFQILYNDEAEYYEGETVVMPTFGFKVLETENKTVRTDIFVLPIPVYSVANPQGGNTVFIGG